MTCLYCLKAWNVNFQIPPILEMVTSPQFRKGVTNLTPQIFLFVFIHISPYTDRTTAILVSKQRG